MKLVTVGDSFPNGLNKYPTRNSEDTRQQINFATQLIKLDNPFSEALNYARAGCNNAMIFDTVLHALKKHKQDVFYLICWTAPTRRYFFDHSIERYNNIPKKFYNISNELNLEIEYAKFIGCCSDLLNYFKIPFIQVNSFYPLQIDKPFTLDYYRQCNMIKVEYSETNTLFDIIADTFCTTKNFRKNRNDNHDLFDVEPNEYIAKCLHPTEPGHKKIAQTLNPIIKNYLPKNYNTRNLK